jgi:hypothetical protein
LTYRTSESNPQTSYSQTTTSTCENQSFRTGDGSQREPVAPRSEDEFPSLQPSNAVSSHSVSSHDDTKLSPPTKEPIRGGNLGSISFHFDDTCGPNISAWSYAGRPNILSSPDFLSTSPITGYRRPDNGLLSALYDQLQAHYSSYRNGPRCSFSRDEISDLKQAIGFKWKIEFQLLDYRH